MTQNDEITIRSSVFASSMSRRVVTVDDIGGCSRQGMGRRRNEDAWGYRDGRAFVLADGMGGRSSGDLAARVTVDALLTELSQEHIDWRSAIANVSSAVCAAAEHASGESIGAVAVGVRCYDDRVTVVHVGDARAHRLRGGTVQQLTRDHSVAEAMADLGVRREESGLGARQLTALASYFGTPGSAAEFSVHELTVRSGDRIVLTSDGVHNSIDRSGWAQASAVPTAGDAAFYLVEHAQQAGATDDSTAVVFDFSVGFGATNDEVQREKTEGGK